MITFLPVADFEESARILDMRRLGKQRVEAHQIYQLLIHPLYKSKWRNHPAVRMWIGYDVALLNYRDAMIKEWVRRGYNNTMHIFYSGISSNLPPWLGDEEFHSSHRAALLAKDPTHYKQFGWLEEPNINYFWPSRQEKYGSTRTE